MGFLLVYITKTKLHGSFNVTVSSILYFRDGQICITKEVNIIYPLKMQQNKGEISSPVFSLIPSVNSFINGWD